MTNKLVGKEIDLPYQGLYEIKDFVHEHYYLVRKKDGYDKFIRRKEFEETYNTAMKINENREKGFPVKKFFEEKGQLMLVEPANEYSQGKVTLYTHGVGSTGSRNPNGALVWGKFIELEIDTCKYTNDVNTLEFKFEAKNHYESFNEFKKGKGDTWIMKPEPLEFTHTNVSAEAFEAELVVLKERLLAGLFKKLNSEKLFLTKDKFGDEKYCFEIYTEGKDHDAEFSIYGGNISNKRFRGIGGMKSVPKSTPVTKAELLTYLSPKIDDFLKAHIENPIPTDDESNFF